MKLIEHRYQEEWLKEQKSFDLQQQQSAQRVLTTFTFISIHSSFRSFFCSFSFVLFFFIKTPENIILYRFVLI